VDTAWLVRDLVQRVRQEAAPQLVAVIDARPLPVGGASQDPEARCGRGAGMWAKGDKFYAIWSGRPVPETYRVCPMNINEDKVAEETIPELTAGGYLLGDGESGANPVFDAAGAAGYQLLAPREHPEAGLGHRHQSPSRLRCIALRGTPFGQGVYTLRRGIERVIGNLIERVFGNLSSCGGGLAPLPAWMRHVERVWLWVSAKRLINAMRIIVHQGLAA
jgi:hypothetical protein